MTKEKLAERAEESRRRWVVEVTRATQRREPTTQEVETLARVVYTEAFETGYYAAEAENFRLREALTFIAADGFKGRLLRENQHGFRDELIAKAREALEEFGARDRT